MIADHPKFTDLAGNPSFIRNPCFIMTGSVILARFYRGFTQIEHLEDLARDAETFPLLKKRDFDMNFTRF